MTGLFNERKQKTEVWFIYILVGLTFFYFCQEAFARSSRQKEDSSIVAFAQVNRNEILLGDKLIYSLIVKSRDDIEIDFPQLRGDDLAGFTVKDFGLRKSNFLGRRVFRQWYLLVTYTSGEHTISAGVIKYRLKKNSEWKIIEVAPVKVRVKSLLAGKRHYDDIRDIKGPKGLVHYGWLSTIIGVILVFLSVVSLVWFSRKTQKIVSSQDSLPAHIIAYEALERLRKKDLIKNGKIKEYYAELSDIVRHYLEDRFNIRAPRMTTEEFLFKMRDENVLSSQQKGLLKDFLLSCDLVKFARHTPGEKEADLAFSCAKTLVDQTKKEEETGQPNH